MRKDIKVLGIDLAKDSFQICGINGQNKVLFNKRVNRKKLLSEVMKLSDCIIGLEACGSAHYWGRLFISMGYKVKLIAPQFVKPYVLSQKNDANDARAIAVALTQAEMRFVGIKTLEQQTSLLSHRARELAVKQRTSQVNQLRGMLLEFGIILPKGIQHIKRLPELLDSEENESKLTIPLKGIFMKLYEQYKYYNELVEYYDAELEKQLQQNEMCQKLKQIEGIGVVTATALVASIGEPRCFKNGRQLSAWLGLVPRQFSTGGKTKLGGITKRGDVYLRTLLLHCARSAIKAAEKKKGIKNEWIKKLKERGGTNKAAVALANKNARIIWKLMTDEKAQYEPSFEDNKMMAA